MLVEFCKFYQCTIAGTEFQYTTRNKFSEFFGKNMNSVYVIRLLERNHRFVFTGLLSTQIL